MTPEEFVDALERACPSAEELKSYGLDDAELDGVRQAFRCPRRPSPVGDQPRHELGDLLSQYDCSTVEIGGVRFLGRVQAHPMGAQFAYLETDPMVVREDGSIAVFEHHTDAVMSVCAASPARFLGAMARLVGIIRDKREWRHQGSKAVRLLADIAGGEVYSAFFRSETSILDR